MMSDPEIPGFSIEHEPLRSDLGPCNFCKDRPAQHILRRGEDQHHFCNPCLVALLCGLQERAGSPMSEADIREGLEIGKPVRFPDGRMQVATFIITLPEGPAGGDTPDPD
jgi:hypothetical protein